MAKIDAYNGNEPYIFISYSHSDLCIQDILQEIHKNGYRFWYDEGIKSGTDWADEICLKIKNCSQFVVFISKNAVLSENIKDEIHIAVKYKVDMLVVYIEDVVLDGGMELHLDRKQAIYKSNYSSENGFEMKIIEGLKNETLLCVNQSTGRALDTLNEGYEILKILSEYKIATSYLALKKTTQTLVFIKKYTLTESIFGGKTEAKALQELSVLKDLNNSNCFFVPQLIDYFRDENNIFIVETFIGGQPLTDVCFTNLDISSRQNKCVSIVLNIAKILHHLHTLSEPIAHRDIKPHNFIYTAQGNVFLVDFNISLRYTSFVPDEFRCWGTVGYAAPEQYDCRLTSDNRCDIYALGILFLQLLTGYDPLNNTVPRGPLRFYDKRFDLQLEKIIEKMTEHDMQKRYSSISDVINDLLSYKEISFYEKIKLHRLSNNNIKSYTTSINTINVNNKEAKPIIHTIPNPVKTTSKVVIDDFSTFGETTILG